MKPSSTLDLDKGFFGPHLQKAQYEELSEMYSPEDEYGLKILTSALVRRAMVDVQRIWQLREEKPSLQNLVRSGVLGEDMMEKINIAEKELEVEVQDLMAEADMYKPGWGKSIFQEATNFMQLQAQQLQQMQGQAVQPTQPQGHNHTSTNGAPKPAPKTDEPLTQEEKEERARKIAEDLLQEEELEKQKAEQRAKSAKGNLGNKAKTGAKKK
ncbi:translocation protein S66 [Phlyctochytrium bullatum]|nr:translocation protein S66 [Phlyctochytrium bullatum]